MHPVLFHIGPVVIPSYGAVAAIAVLLTLLLAQQTARMVRIDANHMWNLCVIGLFVSLVGARLVLVAVNWRDLLRHPLWMFGLAMIHNPVIAAAGGLLGAAAAIAYAHWQRLPLLTTADGIAAPLVLGIACEQFGALLAGAGFGVETNVRWAITYTNPLAARWSGAPLGIPVHPVQGYASVGFLTLSLLLVVWLPARRQAGDIAGACLAGSGVLLYITEIWRDWEGRGVLIENVLDAPQFVGIACVIAGALLLRKRSGLQVPARAPMEIPHA